MAGSASHMSPVASPESATPSAPSSPKSDVFSVSHFQHRRDSDSTASTAFSSLESATSEGEGQTYASCGETRPLFHPAKTAPAVPTLSKLDHPSSEAAVSVSAATKTLKHDPLLRAFPKPTSTATVEEMLARNPGRWSLNHWIKHGAEQRAPAVDKEAESRRFAEAKAALLMSHKEMGSLVLSGGRCGTKSGLAAGERAQKD